MALNLAGLPVGLHYSQDDTGTPSYADSLMRGLNQGTDAYFKAPTLAAKLLDAQLKNKMNKPYADNADEWFNADLSSKKYGNENTLLDLMTKRMNLKKGQTFLSLLGGNAGSSDTSPSTGNPYAQSSEPSDQNTQEYPQQADPSSDQTSSNQAPSNDATQLISPGNSSLYHIDQKYDQYPQYRQEFEKNGYKKTQDIKTDAKTGQSVITTKYPSGKVERKIIPAGYNGIQPLTPAVKTAQQGVITGIDNTIPGIKELIKLAQKGMVPGQGMGYIFHPNKQSSYKDVANSLVDTLTAAYNLPKTNESLELMKSKILKRAGESDSNYVARLKRSLVELQKRREAAKQTLNNGIKLNPSSIIEDEKYDSLTKKTYVKINGEWHEATKG